MTGIERGTIALELSDEFPGLEFAYLKVPGGDGRTPPAVRRRLQVVSDRFRVALAPALRQTGVPSAYRAFWRQIGVDPDVVRSPLDEAIHVRLMDGGFLPKGLLYDSLVIASFETLVPIWAMDGDGIVGGLGVRGAEDGETVEGPAGMLELTDGQLVVADAQGPVVALLSPVGEKRRVTKHSRSIILYCLRVEGVPAMTVAESLNLAAAMLNEG